MELQQIELSESLDGIARIGAVFLRNVSNGPISLELRERTEALAEELRQTIGDRRVGELELVRKNRSLYHKLGVDPTRDRPSSERLLRRVVQGRELPKVNKLVDLVNYTSLAQQCPLSAYDWDKVSPPVLVRIGRPDESYPTPTAARFDLEGRLVVVDGEGLFGNPSHDAGRALVTQGTVRALVMAWVPPDTPSDRLAGILDEISELAVEHTGATISARGVLG